MDIGEVRVLFGWAINYVLGSISGVNIVSCISSGRALAARVIKGKLCQSTTAVLQSEGVKSVIQLLFVIVL